jgi:hypothetical protein
MTRRGRRVGGRAMTGRRCGAAGCGRVVGAGKMTCATHEASAAGRDLETAVGRLARRTAASFAEAEDRAERGAAEITFRRRFARGEYGALFDDRVREVAAQATEERAVKEEIGVLRVTMARLLAELLATDDPVPVAHGVARVATATVRAVQAQRALEPEGQDEFQTTLARVLDEMDAERDAMLAARDAERTAGGANQLVGYTREEGDFGDSHDARGVGVALPDLTSWEMDVAPRWERLGRDVGQE